MKTRVTFPVDAKTLDVLAKFLGRFEKISPEPVHPPKAVLGEDNIIFVEVGYKTDDDAIRYGGTYGRSSCRSPGRNGCAGRSRPLCGGRSQANLTRESDEQAVDGGGKPHTMLSAVASCRRGQAGSPMS